MSIHAQSSTRYQVILTAGKHKFISDEPTGTGDDAGPEPFELLLSALAACMIITVQMYARRKEWPLEKVDLTCDMDSTEEVLPDVKKTRRSVIHSTARFQGALSPEQVDRLAEIAGKCPVHRALEGSFEIHTSGSVM